MNRISVWNVDELPEDHKRSLENLVGRCLEDHLQVCIMALSPGVDPGDKARAEALAGQRPAWGNVQQAQQPQGKVEAEFGPAVQEPADQIRRCVA
jgi:hypothetical protein